MEPSFLISIPIFILLKVLPDRVIPLIANAEAFLSNKPTCGLSVHFTKNPSLVYNSAVV